MQLLAKIRATIAREWQQKGAGVDWELLERMELHQKAVATAIAAQSSGGTLNIIPACCACSSVVVVVV